jgi:transcriptional regulator with XRE-family HTH domain
VAEKRRHTTADKSVPPSADSPAIAVGTQVRIHRQRRALSMQVLAEKAQISRAWLGEIERGTASPSVDIVRRLANALGIPVSGLLDGSVLHVIQPLPEQKTEIQLIRKGNRPTLRFPSQPFAWEIITPLRGELQLMITHMEPTQAPMELMSHGGQESVFVLKGSIQVAVAGEEFDLEEGDCVTFSAQLGHGFMNRGPDVAAMLNATAPPSIGEKWH